MKLATIAALFLATFYTKAAFAQQVNPAAYYIDQEGEAQEVTSIDDGQAPLSVTFRANPSDMGNFSPSYEWHFRYMPSNRYGETTKMEDLMVRYEEDTEYTFTKSGTYQVILKVKLDSENELDSTTITIAISDSRLEFPNAFSPNGDGINDIFKAKDGWRSIVEFHAYVFNRYGQKIYEWTDPSGGWDGTHNGHDVKDGVYFLLVKARGADGHVYHIRKDINILRGYTEGYNSSSSQ